MRKLKLRADVQHQGNDTVITVFLIGDGIPVEVQNGGVYIRLRNYTNYSKRSLYDGLLFLFIFVAMANYDVFEIDGPISKTALRNARVFQEAWHCLLPNMYNVAEIVPRNIASDFVLNARKKDRAISAFSGGLDATFLAVRHTQRHSWAYPLRSCVMVHGFDVWHENDDAFERLVDRVSPFLSDTGLTCFQVKTNIRKFELQGWEHSFSSQLAGILHLYYKSHSTALIGSSEPYNNLVFPWGSTPATDYLLSGSGMAIVHEGAGYSRTEKAKVVASHALGRETLKVCWQGTDQAANCGDCEKCVRTRLNFKAVGLDDVPCFTTPFDATMIDNISLRNIAQLTELRTILVYCRTQGLNHSWVGQLERKILEEQKKISPEEVK
ncbi:hypothetical protein F9K88_07355 [Brucella intermedia]|uniref:hypothetical protein n=1 Tax=Brucella intermedia TaxID=94625 RepID=UPI00124C4809|nr:hypothetical protein [Brucella intermedia]KAB2712768.1 hypothetical protein F9K88_07355 [Brucella intermedia]